MTRNKNISSFYSQNNNNNNNRTSASNNFIIEIKIDQAGGCERKYDHDKDQDHDHDNDNDDENDLDSELEFQRRKLSLVSTSASTSEAEDNYEQIGVKTGAFAISSRGKREGESTVRNRVNLKLANLKVISGPGPGSTTISPASNSGTGSLSSFPLLNGLSDRWKNWVVRGFFGILMVAAFSCLIYLGPVALIVLTLLIQVRCFAEVINIGYTIYKVQSFPWYRFRSLSWYFLITSNYFFYMETSLGIEKIASYNLQMYKTGQLHPQVNKLSVSSDFDSESDVDRDGDCLNKSARVNSIFQFLSSYNRFISFCLYMIGFLWFFVSLSLARKNRKYRGIKIEKNQFNLFAFTHVCLLIVVAQSYLIIQNIFEGMIWFIVPVSMIVCNDAMAYFFGFFMGRTPLIQLSPKKTWEGYIGGGVATVIFGLFFSHFLCQFPFFTCHVQYTDSVLTMMPNLKCEVPDLFTLKEFAIPSLLVNFGAPSSINTYPFVLHSLAMSIFSSVIGPFGGFFASGFKRAFKIKDFADVIPGHGGVLDRFDCQFIMATFVNVYIASFIQPSPERLLQQALNLTPDAQIELLGSLGEHLRKEGLLH